MSSPSLSSSSSCVSWFPLPFSVLVLSSPLFSTHQSKPSDRLQRSTSGKLQTERRASYFHDHPSRVPGCPQRLGGCNCHEPSSMPILESTSFFVHLCVHLLPWQHWHNGTASQSERGASFHSSFSKWKQIRPPGGSRLPLPFALELCQTITSASRRPPLAPRVQRPSRLFPLPDLLQGTAFPRGPLRTCLAASKLATIFVRLSSPILVVQAFSQSVTQSS